ncbi:MAG: type II toxin-antitoxin system HicB family antitoxin [Planktothrix sp.]|uniref:type II toxin-antitoxin system HicB family antitoxin n=2 Tax=Planktothrix TaxID=54304 RepID=UPI0018EF5C96|nr:hypothetical protein [Planktothrix sp. FACHB-1365]
MPMDFYSVVLKKSAGYWVALCLENGIVAQGENPEQSISKLQEAIESFLLVCETEEKVDQSPISILELHEFLTIDEDNQSNSYELRKVYA